MLSATGTSWPSLLANDGPDERVRELGVATPVKHHPTSPLAAVVARVALGGSLHGGLVGLQVFASSPSVGR